MKTATFFSSQIRTSQIETALLERLDAYKEKYGRDAQLIYMTKPTYDALVAVLAETIPGAEVYYHGARLRAIADGEVFVGAAKKLRIEVNQNQNQNQNLT